MLDITRDVDFNATDDYTLGLITVVLREILFRRLRHDNSWCYGVGVSFHKTSKFIAQNIWVKVAPENIKEAEEIIWDTVGRFLNGEYREDTEKERKVEIERTLASEFLSSSIASSAEKQISSGKKIEKTNDYLKGVVNANYDKPTKHLSKYFKKEEAFVEINIPDEFKDKIK